MSDLILEEIFIKRSQQKKKTSPLNYKERLFVLTQDKIAYYDFDADKRVRELTALDEDTHLCPTSVLSRLTVVTSLEQKRKGLRGSVDLEKIKCVEMVEPEPNAPQERIYAFQVNPISISFIFYLRNFKFKSLKRE